MNIVSFMDSRDKQELQEQIDEIKESGGYIPIKGTDYWTEEDKAEIVQSVIESLGGNPVFGYVDENNNIIVSGNLADGSYSVKYEMEDGSTIDIGELVLDVEVKEPTNLFIVGGDGFILNGRCSSAGQNRQDSNGYFVSNYIDIKDGDTLYIKNASVSTDSNSYSGIKLSDGNTIGLFPNSSEYITNYSESNGITQFTVNKEDADCIRICFVISSGEVLTNEAVTNKGVVITVNEPLS